MFSPSVSDSSYPLPSWSAASAGAPSEGGCVVDGHQPKAGFGFARTVRSQLAALAAILLITMVLLGYAVEVAAALLAALLIGVMVDAVSGFCSRRRAAHEDAA